MVQHWSYTGFFNQGEVWADNSKSKRERLQGYVSKAQKRELERQLELYQKFPPGEPHNRLVAQKITIYRVNNPKFGHMGFSLCMASGDLEEIASLDFGNELIAHLREGSVEEVVKENVTHQLPDGSYIRGTQYRQVSPQSSSFQVANQFLDFGFFDTGYGFNIPKEKVQSLPPWEIHMVQYVSINGEIISEGSKDILRPWYVSPKKYQGDSRRFFQKVVKRKS